MKIEPRAEQKYRELRPPCDKNHPIIWKYRKDVPLRNAVVWDNNLPLFRNNLALFENNPTLLSDKGGLFNQK